MNIQTKHNAIKSITDRLLNALKHFHPFRGELVDVEIKMIDGHMVYRYTKVKEQF